MSVFSFIYAAVILITIYLAIKNDKRGIILLIILFPFYTILREITEGQPFFFLWPYIVIGIFMLRFIYLELGGLHNDSKVRKALYATNYVIMPVYYFLLFALTFDIEHIVTGDIRKFTHVFDDDFILLVLTPLLIILAQYFFFYFKHKIHSEGKVLSADILVLVFVVYGLIHIYVSAFADKSLFNAITQYRYYYAMAFFYFLIRVMLKDKEDIVKIAKLGVVVFAVVLSFSYIEAFLLNCMGVMPSSMPWSGVLYELFEYSPRGGQEKVFIEAAYTPMGVMYSQHLTGLLMVIGFAAYYPYFAKKLGTSNEKSNYLLFVLVALLPLGLLFTSKTVIILYILSILGTILLLYKEWKKVVPVSVIFLTVIPFTYSHYLLPCMNHDIGRELSYLIAAATPVNEKNENTESNDKNISSNKKGLLSCIYCDAKTDTRVLNNAFLNLGQAAVSDMKELSKSKSGLLAIFFGSGYSVSDWTKKLKQKDTHNLYNEVSYSDTPYLKFFQQFGVVGLIIFLSMMIVVIYYGLVIWYSKKRSALVVGLTLIIPLSMVATFHLQIYFKTGLNSMLYLVMAFLASLYVKQDRVALRDVLKR